MSKKQKLNKEEELLLNRSKQCMDLLIDCAKMNNFTQMEVNIAVQEILCTLIIQQGMSDKGIDEIMDLMKKFIFAHKNDY